MLNLYEDYASQEERENAVMLEQAEIEMDRAFLALETCNAMEALAMREAECKLVMESGNAFDLVEYYGEATEDTQEKKEGLITRIWNSILNFIKNIKETLFGKSGKAEDDKEYEVEQSWLDKHAKIKAAVDAVKRFFANPGMKAIGIAIAALVAVIGVKAVGKKVKIKGRQVNQTVDEENKAIDNMESGIKSFITKKVPDVLKGQVERLAARVSEVTKHIRTTVANFMGLYTKDQLDSSTSKARKLGKKEGSQAAYRHFKGDIDDARTARNHSKGVIPEGSYDAELESAEDDDFIGDLYGEDAGDLSDIAELLETL